MKMSLYVVSLILFISVFAQSSSSLFNQVEETNWICSTLRGHIGGTFQTISCNLTLPMHSAYPGVDCGQISWAFGLSAVNVTSVEEVFDPVYGLVKTRCKRRNDIEISLTFETLREIHFATTYYIRWKWNGGIRIHPVKIFMVIVCLEPPHVSNSQVSFKYGDFGNFIEGTEAYYTCYPYFSMITPESDHLTCRQGNWQGKLPSCESTINCPLINATANGQCFCESKTDLHLCQPFFPGLDVECVCNEGYQLYGKFKVTCGFGGKWDFPLPDCLQNVGIIQENSNFSGSSSHISMLAIVVATACSVLGVLILIMIIIVFHRRKSHRSRNCRPSSVQLPYSHIHANSLDEHDRMLLLGYDNCPVALPTYEEAVREMHHARYSLSESGGQVGEYRQLPNIPINLRSNGPYSDETNRYSINTTSTMNRDGISDMFGSIDTVNISVSDASTAVTVDTLDSASSHHSNVSRRAAVGSICSLDSRLLTDSVPLLENRTEEIDNDVQDKPEN